MQADGPAFDRELDSLLCYLENTADCMSAANVNAIDSITTAPSAHSTLLCEIQPRVYQRVPSLTFTYNPPPIGKVQQLHSLPSHQYDPADPIYHFAPLPMHPADHTLHAGMPSQYQPPPIHSPAFSDHNYACTGQGIIGLGAANDHPNYLHESTQAFLDPENSFSFPALPCTSWGLQGELEAIGTASSLNILPAATAMEAKHHQISYDQGPHLIYSDQKDFMKTGLSNLNICASAPTRAGRATSHSAAMELLPSTYSTSSFYQLPHERRSRVSVPPPPAPPEPSVNKSVTHASTQNDRVAFIVGTDDLKLDDGFAWKQYGGRPIRKTVHKRSYFRCSRSSCDVVKRTQRCSNDGKYAKFTYYGRHNHHP